MRRILKLLLPCLLLCTLLTGCMGGRELKDRIIVQAMGVDLTKDGYLISLQFFTPQGAGGISDLDISKANSTIFQAEGRTIGEAVEKAKAMQAKDIFYNQNKLVIIGREAAEQGLAPILGYFNGNYQSRGSVNLLLAEGKASDIVSLELNQTILPAQAIDKMLRGKEEAGQIKTVLLMDAVNALETGGRSVYLPIIRKIETEEESPKADQQNDASMEEGANSGAAPKSELESANDKLAAEGLAIFTGDRLADTLTQDETRGFLWATGTMAGAMDVVEVEGLGKVSLAIRESSSSIKAELTDGKPRFEIRVSCYSRVEDIVLEKGVAGYSEEFLPAIEEAQKALLQKQIQAVVDKAIRLYGSDILFLGNRLHQAHPSVWEGLEEHWEETVKHVPITITVQTRADSVELKYHQYQ